MGVPVSGVVNSAYTLRLGIRVGFSAFYGIVNSDRT